MIIVSIIHTRILPVVMTHATPIHMITNNMDLWREGIGDADLFKFRELYLHKYSSFPQTPSL